MISLFRFFMIRILKLSGKSIAYVADSVHGSGL